MPTQPAKRGDVFRSAPAGPTATVTRCSRSLPWVDIDVVDTNGARWSKRMPAGIPASWERMTRG